MSGNKIYTLGKYVGVLVIIILRTLSNMTFIFPADLVVLSLYVISVSADISQISVEFKIGNRGCQLECMGFIQVSMDFYRYPWMFGRYPRTSQLYS